MKRFLYPLFILLLTFQTLDQLEKKKEVLLLGCVAFNEDGSVAAFGVSCHFFSLSFSLSLGPGVWELSKVLG